MTELPLQTLAPAKINLGLFVGPRRADGKHELVSVMQSISLADELRLERSARATGEDEVVCPGVPPELNLASRALAAFREETGWDEAPLRLIITKRVPVAAGLAGGSSDAAAALRLAARASGLGDSELLLALAQGLGADVPGAVTPGRWLASGAGERLRELPEPKSPVGVLILPAARGLSTAAVFEQADRMELTRLPSELVLARRELERALARGAPAPPPELLANDLQDAAIALCPEIRERLALLARTDADAAFLSGSGPTVVGLFGGAAGPERARRAAAALAGSEPPPAVCATVGAHFAPVRGSVRHN